MAQVAPLAPTICGICAEKMRIASALMKPVRTEPDTNRMSTPSPLRQTPSPVDRR